MPSIKKVTHAVKIGDEHFKQLKEMSEEYNKSQKKIIEELIAEEYKKKGGRSTTF